VFLIKDELADQMINCAVEARRGGQAVISPAIPVRPEKHRVTDCLVSEADLASAARQIPAGEIQLVDESVELTENILAATGGQLFVLAGGRRAPNPAEILAGPFFGQLITEAATLFDRVVIDSAPILAVSDTLLMTPHVQTVCMVVRAGKTPRDAVRRAFALLG
jgi:Mrp family chromosome partitioning ATPase